MRSVEGERVGEGKREGEWCYEEKVKIQYMLFPEGIYYNKKTNKCRTKKVSSVWSYIALLKQDSEGNKKGITDLNISYADLVPRAGVEPACL